MKTTESKENKKWWRMLAQVWARKCDVRGRRVCWAVRAATVVVMVLVAESLSLLPTMVAVRHPTVVWIATGAMVAAWVWFAVTSVALRIQ